MVLTAPKVSIVLSDRSWILERLAVEIQRRVEGVMLNDAADPSADINYYMTFACRKGRASTLEIGYFAHVERDPGLQKLFFDTARSVDLSIVHSRRYKDLLNQAGVEKVLVIPPGVDLDRFRIKLRIGVVGRTYHTGRKGEALVAQLMDMPEIDWHFTGSGWPKPGLHLSDEALPDFYRSMDYILVPSLYEGGPMCVPEALAVGTPVIASDVGWVRDFPHIAFATGDAEDLRRVLNELLEEKRRLRTSAEAYTWDNFARGHDMAFQQLLRQAGARPGVHLPVSPPVFAQPVRLLLHGNEATTLGGPSVRVPKSVEELRKLQVPAKYSSFSNAAEINESLVHLFNVWPPKSSLAAMRALKKAGKTVVFSPIYLDLLARSYWQDQLPKLPLEDLDQIDVAYRSARAHLAGRGRLPEPVPGYNAVVREMLALADHVIFLSTAEREGLAAIGATVPDDRASLVHNPVDTEAWAAADPALFRESWLAGRPGPEDYIICVGRIEPRKNQLLLARALAELPVRLVLVGHIGDAAYGQRLVSEFGAQVLLTGRLDPASALLRSALAGAKAFALVSWSEGASLAALEAAAAGCTLVLSDSSSEREYFKDLAYYCDPGSPSSIRAALEAALAQPRHERTSSALQALVRRDNSWERYARDTAKAYAVAAAAAARPWVDDQPPASVKPRIVLDITTLAHHQGRITGISRVELCLAEALRAALGPNMDPALGPASDPILSQSLGQALGQSLGKLSFICWNDSIRKFVEVPPERARLLYAFRHRLQFDGEFSTPAAFVPEDATLIVPGSAWMQNDRYVQGLEDLRQRSGCGLITVIYDLVPFKFPFWFDPGYAPLFRKNFARLASISDHILTLSRSCLEDVSTILSELRIAAPPISLLRSGDPVLVSQASGEATSDKPSDEPSDEPSVVPSVVPSAGPSAGHGAGHGAGLASAATRLLQDRLAGKSFVLAVGAIHARKNYEMLYRVWARFADTKAHPNLHLVIVGGVAWNGQALAEQITSDPRVKQRIHILSDVADEDLDWLYRACLFTVFPSHYEGWGLPVAESLLQGKLCIATSSSSVSEIAPQFVEHLDPEDFIGWHQKISFYAGSASARQAKEAAILAGYKAYPWSKTAQQLVEIVRQPRQRLALSRLHIGERVIAGSDAAPLSIGFRDGWSFPESWGRWAAQPRAELSLRLSKEAQQRQGGIYLLLRQTAHFQSGEVKSYCVEMGGRRLYQAEVSHSSFPAELLLPIPPDCISDLGELSLTFSLPTSPEKPEKPSGRHLGLALVSVALIDEAQSNPLQLLEGTGWFDGRHAAFMDLELEAHRAILCAEAGYVAGWGVTSFGHLALAVPLLPGAPAQEVSLLLRFVATAKSPAAVRVLWAGQEVFRGRFEDSYPVDVSFHLGPELLHHAAPAQLVIETDTLMTPVDLHLGRSAHVYGFGLLGVSTCPCDKEGRDAGRAI